MKDDIIALLEEISKCKIFYEVSMIENTALKWEVNHMIEKLKATEE